MVSLASKVIVVISRASIWRSCVSMISTGFFFATSVSYAPSFLGHYNTVVSLLVVGYLASMCLAHMHILVLELVLVQAVAIAKFFCMHLKSHFLGGTVDDC